MLNNLCKVYFQNRFLLNELHCCSYFVQNALFTAIFNSNVIGPWDDSSSSWKMLQQPWGEALAVMSSLFTEIYILLSTHYGKPEIIVIYIKKSCFGNLHIIQCIPRLPCSKDPRNKKTALVVPVQLVDQQWYELSRPVFCVCSLVP